MGGGGIANVGRPDKSVTVHEFGHSFVGLLDEYTNNPGKPFGRDPGAQRLDHERSGKVPWAHFLKKNVAGVDVFEGGATYIKGVWRPSHGLRDELGRPHQLLPGLPRGGDPPHLLLRRARSTPSILRTPRRSIVSANSGKYGQFLSVTPMKPRSKSLDVDWFVEPIAANTPPPEPEEPRRPGPAARQPVPRRAVRADGRRSRDATSGARAELANPPAGVKNALGHDPQGQGRHGGARLPDRAA